MRRTAIMALVGAVALVAVAAAQAGRLGPHKTRHATVYGTSECDHYSPGHMTADGSDLYRHSDPHRGGVAASNEFPLGTLLRMDRPVFGHRYYRVRDTGGAIVLDIYVPCSRLDPSWSGVVGFRLVR